MKRIYYLPGMISLLAMFPLCYTFLESETVAKQEYALETIWFSRSNLKKDNFFLGSQARTLLFTRYHIITLNGDDAHDLQKLKAVEQEIKRFSKTANFNTGIKIKFGSGTKYWTFVYTLNLLQKLDQKRYLGIGDEILILNH